MSKEKQEKIELNIRDKLSLIYEDLEKRGLKTKDANFVGSARISYFRGEK
jgi:hypothetical protein